MCKHQRYTIDVDEQIGYCHDCKAEGRMVFVVGGEIDKLRAVAEAADYYVAWQGTTSEAVAYGRLCDALDAYNAELTGRAEGEGPR